MVGADLLKMQQTVDDTKKYIPQGADWIKVPAKTFNADENKVILEGGEEVSYDYLIVATGIQLNYENVKGLKEAIEADFDKDKGACSVYQSRYVQGVYRKVDNLKQGDTAIFSQPNTPIKCGGAPQKIMYLTQDHLRRKGLTANISFIIPQAKIFGVPYMAPILADLCKKRNIATQFGEVLVEVRGEERIAVFKKGDELIEYKYDLLHTPPPMGPTNCLKGTSLVTASGFVDVDAKTLQHKKYSNVYALGDCSAAPTAKTAAAVTSQAPVVVHNLMATMNGKKPNAEYDGYTSCPIVTGKGKLILAEFKYGGEAKESFNHFPYSLIFNQREENYPMYFLKHTVFPRAYWYLLKGRWYGTKGIFEPKFEEAKENA
eukprot:CAMPEP_0201519356 /NCGR_PEP_ID=MMETSP0161_2-20130828/9930_1 /ASSEMBLY_ACC=CAM_ASM_000251 /TAXON_ID=180227 /ORGANISM="Neoparamoeba aestuarina, Strain SoJaBio B1-5/56/2" /LENGTH=373 /DNA_ID=CAMNT_0047917367 /DNA_START=290 /DNA_END=1411 /DNA_ORIENTATION=-